MYADAWAIGEVCDVHSAKHRLTISSVSAFASMWMLSFLKLKYSEKKRGWGSPKP